jgi:hypothetical protein
MKYTKLTIIKLQCCNIKSGSSRNKVTIVYTLHGACIQTSVLILYDPKRSRPDGACGVCHVGQCGILPHAECKQLCVINNICIYVDSIKAVSLMLTLFWVLSIHFVWYISLT